MSTNSNMAAHGGGKSLWLRIGKFLFLATLVIALFLLAQSIVRHRFFRGGRIKQRDSLRP